MNREDIIRMAREAGLVNWEATAYANELERFAALVASAEHKRVQQVYTDAATDSVKAAIAYEREACAKLCEKYTDDEGGKFIDHEGHGYECAAAIRARGQA